MVDVAFYRALLRTISPWPWEAGRNAKAGPLRSNAVVVRPEGEFPHGAWVADVGRQHDDQAAANATFIAAAPEAVANLCDEVERLRGAIARAEAELCRR